MCSGVKYIRVPKDKFYIAKIALLFVGYYLTARIGLSLDAVGGFATLVWIPTGLSLAVLLLYGRNLWPAIFLGALAANWSVGAPFLVAIFIAIGNTLEAAIAAYILSKVFRFRRSIERLSDALGLIAVGALFSTLISATIGASSLVFSGQISSDEFFATWSAWWIGDAASDLVVAPLILVWSRKINIDKLKKNFLELLLIGSLSTIIAMVIFLEAFQINQDNFPIAYIIFPPLIWVALRFGQRGAVTASFVISAIAILGTALGLGSFAFDDLARSLLFVQSFMVIMATTALILGAVESERKELSEKKDDFLMIASHELKTPITTIKAYSQLLNRLLKNNGDPKASIYAEKLNDQIDRLTKLVADLLDVSRIQVDKLELVKESFSVDEFVKVIAQDTQHAYPKYKIEVQGKVNKKISADKYRLEQVFHNLVSNAVKFSPKSNKIIIKVSTQRNYLVISVTDFGIGISAENKPHVFERFFQVNTKIRQSFSGFGLGLFISYEIIKKHKGDMWVNSKKGKGSTFTFRLPLVLK